MVPPLNDQSTSRLSQAPVPPDNMTPYCAPTVAASGPDTVSVSNGSPDIKISRSSYVSTPSLCTCECSLKLRLRVILLTSVPKKSRNIGHAPDFVVPQTVLSEPSYSLVCVPLPAVKAENVQVPSSAIESFVSPLTASVPCESKNQGMEGRELLRHPIRAPPSQTSS